jgi:tRNA acetyltransferase TAN1
MIRFLGRGSVIKLFNLIASTFRYREIQAEQELGGILNMLGDPLPEVRSTTISGLLIGQTQLDPFSIPHMLVRLLNDEPWIFKYVQRVIPIQKVVNTELDMIRECVRDIASKIKPSETYRITVEKRHNTIRSTEIIHSCASTVERKVNLANPDWIILIEVIQTLTGLSIIKPYQIFSAVTELRKLGERFIS